MMTVRRITGALLLLTAVLSLASCGKKTPLFFSGRSGSYGIDGYNNRIEISNLRFQIKDTESRI